MRAQDLFSHLEIPFIEGGHHHCRPGYLQFDCPWCSKDWRHFRMGYNLARRYVHCWACGGHRLDATLAEASGKPRSYVQQFLGDVPREAAYEADVRGTLELPPGLQPLAPAHRKYLKGRKYDPDAVAARWGVQGIGMLGGKLRWRIFIPVVYRGEVVSWTTRAITDDHKLRYRSAEARQEKVDHKTLLYGEDLCHHSVIVCEGPLDVWRVGPGAVATFGTAFTRAQVLKIAKYPRRLVCYDSEPHAQTKALELCDMLEAFPGETANAVLSGKDPGSASPREIRELRRWLD